MHCNTLILVEKECGIVSIEEYKLKLNASNHAHKLKNQYLYNNLSKKALFQSFYAHVAD